MRLPAYWWLLAMAVIPQGWFFVRYGILRGRGKAIQPFSRPAAFLLAGAGLSGLAYGAVQRDPLFFVGQACLLILYYLLRTRNDERQ